MDENCGKKPCAQHILTPRTFRLHAQATTESDQYTTYFCFLVSADHSKGTHTKKLKVKVVW